MRRSLIIGAAGQDGTILARQLERVDRRVFCVGRKGSAPPLVGVNLLDFDELEALIRSTEPDEIYYLAAHHGPAELRRLDDDIATLQRSREVHLDGWLTLLEAARHRPSARLFYAASSHVFGASQDQAADERAPFAPESAYGLTKAMGVEAARYYRRKGVFVSTGILFNHESPLRPAHFVSARICRGAALARGAADRGQPFLLELANPRARVDWGYAPDYTDAMRRMMELESPDDFVVATGILNSVAWFCELAFRAVGLDWREYVREGGRGPKAVVERVGNASKLRAMTGWRPSLSFEELVEVLVRAQLFQGTPWRP